MSFLPLVTFISFNGQGQLCPLTCVEWRDLPNHTRMSTAQSRTPEKKAKKKVTLTLKFPWKSCSTPHLPFLSSNPKILKAFLKTFPTAREKKRKEKKCKKIKRGEEKAKSKSQDRCVTLKSKNYLKILLSVHAQTSQANILHLDQKAAKCIICTWLCGMF